MYKAVGPCHITMTELFCENSYGLKAVPSQISDRLLNMPVINVS